MVEAKLSRWNIPEADTGIVNKEKTRQLYAHGVIK